MGIEARANRRDGESEGSEGADVEKMRGENEGRMRKNEVSGKRRKRMGIEARAKRRDGGGKRSGRRTLGNDAKKDGDKRRRKQTEGNDCGKRL